MPCTCGSLSPTRCLCTIDEALRNIDVDLCSTIPLSSAQTDALKSTEDALRRCNATFRAANDYNRRVLVYFRLIPIIDRLYTLTSVEGADAFDGLAECLLHQRIWDSAIEAAQSVLKTREEPRFGGAGVGTAYDRGKSRKAMAKALEGQGKLLDARVVRLRGKETDTLVCAYAECAGNRTFPISDLRQCSACKCIFYCSASCQTSDWTRHKEPCKAHGPQAKVQVDCE